MDGNNVVIHLSPLYAIFPEKLINIPFQIFESLSFMYFCGINFYLIITSLFLHVKFTQIVLPVHTPIQKSSKML